MADNSSPRLMSTKRVMLRFSSIQDADIQSVQSPFDIRTQSMYTHIQLYSWPIMGLSGYTATLQQGPLMKNNMHSFMYNIICIFIPSRLQYLIKKVHVLSCDSSTTMSPAPQQSLVFINQCNQLKIHFAGPISAPVNLYWPRHPSFLLHSLCLNLVLDNRSVSVLSGDHDGNGSHAAEVGTGHPGGGGRGQRGVTRRPLVLL